MYQTRGHCRLPNPVPLQSLPLRLMKQWIRRWRSRPLCLHQNHADGRDVCSLIHYLTCSFETVGEVGEEKNSCLEKKSVSGSGGKKGNCRKWKRDSKRRTSDDEKGVNSHTLTDRDRTSWIRCERRCERPALPSLCLSDEKTKRQTEPAEERFERAVKQRKE